MMRTSCCLCARCVVCVFPTLRPVPRCTTGTLSSPVKELMSSLVGSLQRCLRCFGRSTKPCSRPAPDCSVGENRQDWWERRMRGLLTRSKKSSSFRKSFTENMTLIQTVKHGNKQIKCPDLHEWTWGGPCCIPGSVSATRSDLCSPPLCRWRWSLAEVASGWGWA